MLPPTLNVVVDEFDRHAQYAPISGTIEEINERLSDQPGLLNKSAEDEGGPKRTNFSNFLFTSGRLALQNQNIGPIRGES